MDEINAVERAFGTLLALLPRMTLNDLWFIVKHLEEGEVLEGLDLDEDGSKIFQVRIALDEAITPAKLQAYANKFGVESKVLMLSRAHLILEVDVETFLKLHAD